MRQDQQMVGMSQIKTAKGPAIYTCIGLGSCIGVAAFDPETEVSGMVHIMLPAAFKDKPVERPGKYADTGIMALLEELERLGADPARLIMAYAGGAQVFQSSVPEAGKLDVGARNGNAVGKILTEMRANVIGCDVGGNQGRAFTFCTLTGQIRIRTVTGGEKPLCNVRQIKLRSAA